MHFLNFITNSTSTCNNFCSDPPVNDATIYLTFLPLSGISYLLVFITVLEFICAQSPNAPKGLLLIEIMYSMSLFKYMVNNILNIHTMFLESTPWNIYHGIKGFGIFSSVFASSVVCKIKIDTITVSYSIKILMRYINMHRQYLFVTHNLIYMTC